MDAALQRGLQAPGDDFIQRQALEEIIKDAYYAGKPVLDYLLEKLQPAPAVTQAQVEAFKCTHPDCKDKPAFSTQMALNGHMKKHASNP
ncbi:hypothetical protein [Runella sp.]|uniref:hypothetical protein n=1 Tax=Runella sp. TaxID=1960881 RepID=UPI003D12C02C